MTEHMLIYMTPGKIAVGLLIFWFIYYRFRRWQSSRDILRLGEKAPQIPTYLPFSIDFIYKSIRARNRNRDLEFWLSSMKSSQGKHLDSVPATAEVNSGISNSVIFTMDPENIKTILTSQFSDYGKGKSFHREWKEFLGDSIFVTDGELWSRSRRLIRPMFVRERIVDTHIFEKHVQRLIPLLRGSSSPTSGRRVDIAPLFFRYILDASTDYLLGQGTDSLINPTTRVAEAFKYVQLRQAEYIRMGQLSGLLSRKKFRRELRVINEFIQPYIERALSLNMKELGERQSKQDTFLDALARFTRDPCVLRDQLITILLAGRDTTAVTLSFCVFELSRNPEVVAKLRSDIESRLGLGASGCQPTYDDLKDMKYLNAVLNETLRLYPAVPFNMRSALRDTTLPRGGGPDGLSPIGIRKGTRIVYSTMLMQRRPELYDGPDSPTYFDPGKWVPERWLSNWQPKPWQFIPFNGGPRICLGQQFARIEMGYTITRILQTYDQIVAIPVAGKERVEEPVLQFEITLIPGAEMNCAFVRDGEKIAKM